MELVGWAGRQAAAARRKRRRTKVPASMPSEVPGSATVGQGSGGSRERSQTLFLCCAACGARTDGEGKKEARRAEECEGDFMLVVMV